MFLSLKMFFYFLFYFPPGTQSSFYCGDYMQPSWYQPDKSWSLLALRKFCCNGFPLLKKEVKLCSSIVPNEIKIPGVAIVVEE